jgi:ankyrin repeat protein
MLLAFILTGCAGVALDGKRLDVEVLNNAIATDNLGYFRSAVQAGAIEINQRISAPGYLEGTPVITLAAKHAALDILRYLIDAGANVNALTPVNETPVMLAAFFYEEVRDSGVHSYDRHEKAVHMLVAAGAYLENGEFEYTPLAYAAYQGHDRIVHFLLERGARVDADARDGRSYVNTPLMMAAIQGHRKTTDSLLRAGANPRVRGYHGQTAAELAVKHKHMNIFQLLKCAENVMPGGAFARGCR